MEEFGLVLAGGGGKGAYQVGVFNALLEFDIKIMAVSGTSVGGINAFAYACLTNEEINKLWDDFKFVDFFRPDDDWSDGISDRIGLENILNRYVDEEKLHNAIPIFNTICETPGLPEYKLLNNKSKEEVTKILLATSALPAIYSKVEINGKMYQDGGIADNLPVAPLYENDYRDFIVVSLSKGARIDKNRFKVNKLIEIVPSHDLGAFMNGTLNFSQDYKEFAKRLGYYDAKRALNNWFGYHDTHTEDGDYRQIMEELKVHKLQRQIDYNKDRLNKYI